MADSDGEEALELLLNSITVWAKDFPDNEGEDDSGSDGERTDVNHKPEMSSGNVYPVRKDLNSRIAIWQGVATNLPVDAIVNTNNDTLSDRTEFSGQIHDLAGHELEKECRKYVERSGKIRIGEVAVTGSGKIKLKQGHATHIIHAVAPEWKDERFGGPEKLLENCYHNALEACKSKFHSVAISVLKRKDYPRERAAHICIRTIRRFLEHHASTNLVVVLCFRQQDVYDQMLYEMVLPLYFPRTKQESDASKEHLVKYEEQWQAEHEMEMQQKDQVAALTSKMPTVSFSMAPQQHHHQGMGGGIPFSAPPSSVDPTEFPRTFSDVGVNLNIGMGGSRSRVSSADVSHEDSLFGLMSRAFDEDLSDIEALNLFFLAGEDQDGLPMLYFIEAHMPNKREALDRVLMFIIRTLEKVANQKYVLVYVSRWSSPEYVPDIKWFKNASNMFDKRFSKNLSKIYIVHPSLWVKTTLTLMRPFSSAKTYEKIQYIQKLTDMFPLHKNGIAPALPQSPSIRLYVHGDELPPEGHFTQNSAQKGLTPFGQDKSNYPPEALQEIDDLAMQLEVMKKNNQQLKTDLEKMAMREVERAAKKNEQLDKISAERDSLAQERETLTAHMSEAENAKKNALEAQKRSAQLEAQLNQVEIERDQLSKELQDISSVLGDAISYNKMMMDEITAESEEIKAGKDALIAQMAVLEMALKRTEDRNTELEKEISQANSRMENMKQFFDDQFNGLQDEIQAVQEVAASAIEKSDQSRKAVFDQVNRDMVRARTEVRNATTKVTEVQSDNQRLLEVIAQLQEQLGKLKSEAEANNGQINIVYMDRIIQEASTNVETIQNKIDDDANDEERIQLRQEMEATKTQMEQASAAEREALQAKINELQQKLVASRKATQTLELSSEQHKVLQFASLMMRYFVAPVHEAFAKWRAVTALAEVHNKEQQLLDMQERLRRDTARFNTRTRQLEDENEAFLAEIEHLKKKATDAAQAIGPRDAKIKDLEELIKKERTRHMAKMEESLSQLEEEKDRVLAENVKLNQALKKLRTEMAALESGGGSPHLSSPPAVEAN